MLAEADDAHAGGEALEQVAHLERLAHIIILVHVERLQVLAAREHDRVVLVLGLTRLKSGPGNSFTLYSTLSSPSAVTPSSTE